jgi:acyl-CoA synthetase (AMP-forming)/AMP-acid ligase II
VPAGRLGAIVVKLPLPPGCLPTLWNADRASDSVPGEHPGYYKTGDAGYVDEDGYVFVMGAHRRRHQRRRPPPVHRGGWRRSSPRIPTSPNAP